jgi:hypothetical protein
MTLKMWTACLWVLIASLHPLTAQIAGSLSGRIVFTSAGHGWTYDNSADVWYTQRGDNNEIVEDYGNLDQMNLFVAYCFNAGATVVPLRPVGFQTNEVIVDNDSPAVRYFGVWTDSSATNNFYGNTNAVPYRFASLSSIETTTATYTPTIPASGFYPVYSWVAHGTNRTGQLYRINHTGGQSLVRVPHHMVGNGWVYLGTYYFNTGSNSIQGSVVISNLQPTPKAGLVVIADAIRFGNGMGDVRPTSTSDTKTSNSGYPREEECARYWVQRSVGVGAPATLYGTNLNDESDNVGAPARMAAHMNREDCGNIFKRIFLSFHSNAGGGRGCMGLYNNESLFPGTSTPHQFRLAQLVGLEVNGDMGTQTGLEVPWFTRATSEVTSARSDFAFGEISNLSIDDEFDATIIEVAFHDSVDDAKLMRDPKVRNVMARASYQAIVRYMNEFDSVPLTFLPEPPRNPRATANNTGGIVLSWDAPGSGGGPASGFLVYRSTNGYGFGFPVPVSGGAATSIVLTNLEADRDWYFQVAATNSGGESVPSITVGCRRSSRGDSPVLFVNGFDRFDRPLNVRQTAGPGIGGPNGGIQTFDRIKPRLINSFDYVVQHGQALSRNGVAFNSCQNEAIIRNQIRLTDYQTIIWAAGQESTLDETFHSTEQARIAEFLNAGGNLFVSGAEIAWDLDRDTGPTAADRNFFNHQLHADLQGNTNDDAATYTFTASTNGIFAGNADGRCDDGAAGIYNVQYPDVLTPLGAGAMVAIRYSGASTGPAAIQYAHPTTGSKLVYFGFPFEAITSAAIRESYLFDILNFFEAIPAPILSTPMAQLSNGVVILSWSTSAGKRYRVQYKSNLSNIAWTTLGVDVIAGSDSASKTDHALGGIAQRFYRVLLID